MPLLLTNLLGMNKQALEAFLASIGEKPFRAVQLLKWIHQHGVTDFGAMSNISRDLREKLKTVAEIRPPRIRDTFSAQDGCYKWIVEVESGSGVEMVYIPEAGRGTLCISSQAGCSLDCTFCATGKQGFNGNLSAADIIGQLWLANRELAARGQAVTNVVLMGMGEPLLNFDNVLIATNLMMEDLAFGLSKRRVTVSTAGVVPGIRRLAEHTDVALAISLHAPNDALRDVLVPINRKYPIAMLLEACRDYLAGLGPHRSVTIEYTLLKGVNDTLDHARELAALLRDLRCKINLIPFNPFPASGYERPDMDGVRAFQTLLLNAGYATMLRTTRGDDIQAACGQLVGQVEDRTRRQARYIARVQAEAAA